MQTNKKTSKRSFWNSGFCSMLIIICAFFVCFGITCTVWRAITSSQSVVSDGNVFGYSIVDVHSNNFNPTFKAGDKVVVHHTDLGNVPTTGYVVYNVSNSNGMVYDICKINSMDADTHTINITTNQGTRNINSSLYVGTVVTTSDIVAGMVEVVNSNIMLWLFCVGFGVVFVTLLICRKNALRHQ